MERIAVVGATGSGKTSLCEKLALHLKIPHFELDGVFWGPDWIPIPLDDFRQQVDTITRQDTWVIDGNYGKVHDLVWARADTLVWLDYPILLVYWRLIKRSIPRVFTKVELWNGNRETFKNMFLSRDSLFVWLAQSYRKQRKSYPLLLKQPKYSHLNVFHLRKPREADAWMKTVIKKL